MISCISEMLNPNSSFLIMIFCLLPSFPWYIYFFNLTETINSWIILLCSNVDPLTFLLSSRPHDSSFSPHLTLTGLFFYGLTLLNQIFNFFTLPGLLRPLGGNLWMVLVITKINLWSSTSATKKTFCVFSLCCPQAVLQIPTHYLFSHSLQSIQWGENLSHQKAVPEFCSLSCKPFPRTLIFDTLL